MSYVAPYIDNTGLHVNTYPDILDYFVNESKRIFGEDIYLENDSSDYQMLSILARAIYEEEQALMTCYQARSPMSTTSRDALDGLMSINGLRRKEASYSMVTVTLTGTAYTQIIGGVVQSTDGSKWSLPQEVVLSSGGTASVVATAQEEGAITALPGTITQIVTPTYGWTSVTNPSAASVGQPVETNAQAIARQQTAVATPSQTPLEGTKAGIYNVPGITQFRVYENDTSAADDYDTATSTGGPANSITAVVEGGDSQAIGEAIAYHKTPGCYTAGDVTVVVVDSYGAQNNIRFYRPTYENVYATFTIEPLTGYSSATADMIKEAVVNYISKLQIGDNLYLSQLWEAALSSSPDLRPLFSLKSVTAGTAEGEESTDDLIADFDTCFRSTVDKITIEIQENE